MSYKIGDKVRIREDLEVGKIYGSVRFVEERGSYRGKETIVTSIFSENAKILYYELDRCGRWPWTPEMLEPVEEEHQKPPLGIMPKDIWLANRKVELKETVIRYVNAGLPLPQEWVDEYNEFVKEKG